MGSFCKVKVGSDVFLGNKHSNSSHKFDAKVEKKQEKFETFFENV